MHPNVSFDRYEILPDTASLEHSRRRNRPQRQAEDYTQLVSEENNESMKIQTRHGAVNLPRVIFSTYDFAMRRRCFKLIVLRKPKQPVEEGELLPTWLNLQFPPPYLTYYAVTIADNTRHQRYIWPHGFRVGAREYTVVPVWFLKFLSRMVHAARKVLPAQEKVKA